MNLKRITSDLGLIPRVEAEAIWRNFRNKTKAEGITELNASVVGQSVLITGTIGWSGIMCQIPLDTFMEIPIARKLKKILGLWEARKIYHKNTTVRCFKHCKKALEWLEGD